MVVCSPVSTCSKNVTCLIGTVRRPMSNGVFDVLQLPTSSCCFHNLSNHPKLAYSTIKMSSSKSCSSANWSLSFQTKNIGYSIFKYRADCHSLAFKSKINPRCYWKMRFTVPTGYQVMNSRILLPGTTNSSKSQLTIRPVSWEQRRTSAGLFIGLFICFSTSSPAHAESLEENDKKKKVITDYSVIGIPGDGRCLFRSVAHGACLRSGKSHPNDTLQRELADELRAQVADEFVKRREETEWFIEGDFDTYVSKIRKPHEWGGEPELLMASHVLKMPITVYMHDKDFGGLRAIAEYGQEYGKDNPIEVLYHGFGHYDALHRHSKGGARPRL